MLTVSKYSITAQVFTLSFSSIFKYSISFFFFFLILSFRGTLLDKDDFSMGGWIRLHCIEGEVFSPSGQVLIHRNRCRYCSSGENLTIDHVIPISRGGKWEWENLVCESSTSTICSFYPDFWILSRKNYVHVLFELFRWLPVPDATPGRVRRHWNRQTWSCTSYPGYVPFYLAESWLLQGSDRQKSTVNMDEQ